MGHNWYSRMASVNLAAAIRFGGEYPLPGERGEAACLWVHRHAQAACFRAAGAA